MKEFITLMASLMALVAITIDAMLPALGIMAHDLNVARANDIQLVVGFIFVGMTAGQIIYGPLADAIGRKTALYSGLLIFIIGSLVSFFSDNLTVMLIGRLLQGIGVAAPRVIIMAIVRDKHHGRDMAYIMSMVMGVFILVPAIAPTIGQFIIHLSGWRGIFMFYIIATVTITTWMHLRLEETLSAENHRSFNVKAIISGFKEAATNRITLGYSLCCGTAFGALLAYLQSAQQIFHEMFHTGDKFALYFGILALAIGAAFFSNSSLVQKHGMRKITRISLYSLIACSTIYFYYVLNHEPTLLSFMIFASAAFFFLGLMFGNMNSMAMEPMGHMAGLASAFIGAFSSAISMLLGTIIAQSYNGTLLPLVAGFFVLSITTALIMEITEKKATTVTP